MSRLSKNDTGGWRRFNGSGTILGGPSLRIWFTQGWVFPCFTPFEPIHSIPKIPAQVSFFLRSLCFTLCYYTPMVSSDMSRRRSTPACLALRPALSRPLTPLFPIHTDHDYLLDKSTWILYSPFMDSKPHFFLGLRADAVIARKSFLMLASNLRVDTFLISFFLPSSNGASLWT